MLFNSFDFAVFLPLVFAIYWGMGSGRVRLQNVFLLVASYVFYGWWDWRFLGLIAFSSLVDYWVGVQLATTGSAKKRRLLLGASIAVNVGFLMFFKYFNFFVDSFVAAFSLFGQSFEPFQLQIILPVGISFYTFQTLSYSIDVYRRKMEPSRDPVAFFAYVSFFPQLVAGPIERALNLLPQFYQKRTFDDAQARDGLRQILWGLFKKTVVADSCAFYVNEIFADPGAYSGSTLLMGAVFFSFQIYGDFSGYSDMAIGTARLFGFRLSQNFAFPYFSRNIGEFWRRWHISLSTWFRDYLYIPLGGSRGSLTQQIRNVFIIFLVSGFWHGANWTFLVWGGIHACCFLPLLILKRNRRFTDTVATGSLLPGMCELIQITATFLLATLAFVFFRAPSVAIALEFLGRIFSGSLLEQPLYLPMKVFGMITILLLVEWLQRERQHGLEFNGMKIPVWLRWGIYFSVIALITFFAAKPKTFIYFQF